jgi:transposase
MDKGGRPTKLTPELQEELCKVIRAGNYIETACAYVGINKSSVYDWMKRGAREKQRIAAEGKKKPTKRELPFVEFSNAIEKALSHSEVRDVAIIGKAAEQNWQAAAWRLERKFPDRWGRKDKQQIEHSGKDGGPIETSHTEKLDLSNLSDKELADLENIIRKSTEPEGHSD